MAELGRRAKWALAVPTAFLLLVAATYALARATMAWQGAVTSIATLLAALATAWAAYQARRAALASADSSRDARLALALHDRAWPHVHLWREEGLEGGSWTWYVTIGAGRTAAGLHMTWTVDGVRREAAWPNLKVGEIWQHPAHIAHETDAADLWRRIGSVNLEWQDEQALMRWQSLVEIAEGTSEGIPAPYAEPLASTSSHVPFVNNSEPRAVW